MTTHDDTRQTLIARALNRSDEEAWNEFTGIYTSFIRGVLHRLQIDYDDVDDLVQEIVVTLWQKLEYYVPAKGSFRVWLASVTRNKSNTYLRKKIRYNDRKKDLYNSEQENLSEPEIDRLIDREWQAFISKKALERLSSIFEDNTVQCFLDNLAGIPAEDTARKFDLSIETVYSARKRVKARMLREIKNLRENLEF